MQNTGKLIAFLPILIIVLTSTFIQGWIPLFSMTWVFLVVGFLMTAVLWPKYLLTRQFALFAMYFFVVYINYLIGDNYFHDPAKVITDIMIIALFPLITSYIFCANNVKTANYILIAFAIVIVSTAIGTLLVDFIFPSAVRTSISEALSFQDTTYTKQFYKMGMSNYTLPHALPVLIPPLFAFIKSTEVKINTRIICGVVLTGSLVIVWLSGSTTATLLAVFMTIICLFTSNKNRKSVIIILLLVTPILVSRTFHIYLLRTLIPLFSSEGVGADFVFHLQSLLDSAELGTAIGDYGSRIDLYGRSLDAFYGNVIFGTNTPIGGHSAIVDHLASLGLLGMIPLIAGCWIHCRFVSTEIDKRHLLFYRESVIVAILMMGAKNMSNVEMWLCWTTISPIMFFVLERIERNSVSSVY